MQKLFPTLLLLFTTLLLNAQGVSFENGGWEEVINKAKKENRLIFIDAYTTWCGPCKKMSRDVFTKDEVGNFYNSNFVNVKMDMEKGVGLDLAERYDVKAYPTLLFINSEGDLIHRAAGYHEPGDFLTLGQTALDPNTNISAFEKRYESGDRDPDFLRKYTNMRYYAADGSHVEVANAYIETQDDLSTEENMEFIVGFVDDIDSKGFQYLMKNRPAFEEKYGQRNITGKIQNLIYNKIYYGETKPTLEEIEGIFQKFFPEKSGELYSNFKMSYFRQLGDRKGYADAAIERYAKYDCDDYSQLNETAWTFYEVIDDKDYLKKALKWGKKSVKLSNRYENNDTVAHLYYKLGCKRKAMKYAKKSIELAREKGDDFSITQALIEKINQMD